MKKRDSSGQSSSDLTSLGVIMDRLFAPPANDQTPDQTDGDQATGDNTNGDKTNDKSQSKGDAKGRAKDKLQKAASEIEARPGEAAYLARELVQCTLPQLPWLRQATTLAK